MFIPQTKNLLLLFVCCACKPLPKKQSQKMAVAGPKAKNGVGAKVPRNDLIDGRLAVGGNRWYGGIIGYNYNILLTATTATSHLLLYFIIISYLIAITTPLNPLFY